MFFILKNEPIQVRVSFKQWLLALNAIEIGLNSNGDHRIETVATCSSGYIKIFGTDEYKFNMEEAIKGAIPFYQRIDSVILLGFFRKVFIIFFCLLK